MESFDMLSQSAQYFTTAKYLRISAVALTLYDYSLMFDDEIRYIWRGRKSWIFYLYILNRILLVVYQFWEIYYLSSPMKSETLCRISLNVQVISLTTFSLASDIFILLRLYAITFKNKILAAYFGTLTLARLTTTFVLIFVKPPTFVELPPVPIDAFNICAMDVDIRLLLIPSSLGTAFELSAFLVIALYTYSNKRALKFSAVVSTIVSEATIYFLAMVAVQTFIQISMNVMEDPGKQLSFLAYGILPPILTMRFAVSLKRSADPEAGHQWRLAHFSSPNFAGSSSRSTQVSTVRDSVGFGLVNLQSGRVRTGEPQEAGTVGH